ncbi:hypothetical protein RYH73_26350 [Olivibacter sp. CPCC 100613]
MNQVFTKQVVIYLINRKRVPEKAGRHVGLPSLEVKQENRRKKGQ